MNYLKQISLLSTLLMLTSCFAQPPAPYVDKSKGVYHKGAEKTGGSKSAPVKQASTFTSYDGTPAKADTEIVEAKLAPIAEQKVVMEKPVEQTKKDDQMNQAPVAQTAEQKPVAASAQPLVDSQPAHEQVVQSSAPIKATTSAGFKLKNPLNLSNYDWPVEGNVLSRYGKLGNKFNEGLNISAPLGAPVTAASDGKVVYIGNNVEGYGNLLILRHDNDLMTAYAHMKDIVVQRGAMVKKGESVGSVGQAGNVSQPQLHFSVRKGKKTIDPESPLS